MTKSEILFARRSEPLTVLVLVLPRASILELASILDPMRNANRQAGREVFRWRVVTPSGAPVPLTCGIELPSAGAFHGSEPADLLMIVSGYGQSQEATPALIAQIRRRATQFQAIGGVDSGPWIMARAGLLQGHRATVHWEDLEDFAAQFPDIDVVSDRTVISGRRVTIGGAVPAADFMLALIAQCGGAALAGQVAHSFLYDPGADLSRPQRPGLLPAVRDARVGRALALMGAHLEDPLPLDQIAARLRVSRRRLEQIFVAGLGQGPARAYLDLRLQAARRMREDTHHPLSEIALRHGFPNTAAFTRAYRRKYGRPIND